jgi:predicted nucleic acid binding AN1-type Zn finger protein
MKLYLDSKDLEHRRIAFIHCEDEKCGFLVEFKYPNCTFYFCKQHRAGFNLDLNTVSEAGVVCEVHGTMERYDLLADDNVCPACGNAMLAIVSVGK